MSDIKKYGKCPDLTKFTVGSKEMEFRVRVDIKCKMVNECLQNKWF